VTPEELQEAIAELKAQGASEEDIAASFYLMFSEGKINLEQFQALLDAIDYELDEEFLNMDEQTQRTFALNGNDNDVPPSESDEGENNPAPQREGEKDESDNDKDESNDSPKEDKEEDKAMRLFGK
jgi:hypothetical protein